MASATTAAARRSSARETAMRVAAAPSPARCSARGAVRAALVQVGPHPIDRALGLGRDRAQPFWSPDAAGGRDLGRLPRRSPQGGLLGRRHRRGGRLRRPPAGLGDPVFDRLDADLAKALMSIPAVKGRDRRRLRRSGDVRAGAQRRHADARRRDLPVEQRRRPGRHLLRPGHRRPDRHQADELRAGSAAR